MNDFKFQVAPAPHVENKDSISEIMIWVILALMPVTAAAVYWMGVEVLIVIAMAIIGAVGTEYILNRLAKLPQTITNGSAFLTGLLLALTLPPKVGWWIPLLGGFIAICVAKYFFGGLGHNIFNPALSARAILFLSWPGRMTTSWFSKLSFDTVSKATPLYIAKAQIAAHKGYPAIIYAKNYLLANKSSSIGEVSVVFLLVGAAILLYKRIIDWRIPTFYIGTVVVLTTIAGRNPIFYALAGGLIIGAFFMATDYVTSPITPKGRIIFGIGLGVTTVLLRFFSNLPEGVMFAILFMNMLAPLIEKYTRPKVLGLQKKKKEAGA